MKFQPKGRHPKEILNEIKWRGLPLEECEIDYLHRGAPHDRITIKGDRITPGKSFFSYGDAEIPYHRIMKIRLKGDVIFKRE